MQPAIFLDRDGVIIENRDNYVRSWEDVSIYPQALEALHLARPSPYKIVIITNQSAIGRGLITARQAEAINQRLVSVIEAGGGRVDGVFVCPHAPEAACSCRKPLPGLFFQAAEALQIDLPASTMIGDAWSDLQAGQAAGIQQNVLVMTGRGLHQASLTPPPNIERYLIYPDLRTALQDLIFADRAVRKPRSRRLK
jgi:D-glycero-D-manno-heptose 1,7-bisphosphate phosphatase